MGRVRGSPDACSRGSSDMGTSNVLIARLFHQDKQRSPAFLGHAILSNHGTVSRELFTYPWSLGSKCNCVERAWGEMKDYRTLR
jgi:hypothetical protein